MRNKNTLEVNRKEGRVDEDESILALDFSGSRVRHENILVAGKTIGDI